VSNVEAVTYFAGFGDDHITGAGGADILIGAVGDDTLSGGAGNDIMEGGSGADRLDGGRRQRYRLLHGQHARGDGEPGNQPSQRRLRRRRRPGRIENLTGSTLADALTGDAGANILNGGAGADRLDAAPASTRRTTSAAPA